MNIELRDYFAGQVLAGMCANPDVITDRHALAPWCYEVADAMLAAK